MSNLHTSKTRRDRYQLSHRRYKTTDKRADNAIADKELLCLYDLLLVKQTHMSQAAICELIDDRFAEP